MLANRKHQPKFQYNFYRTQYHKMLRALIFNFALILCLIVAIIYFATFQPASHYYATTLNGQVIPIQPITK